MVKLPWGLNYFFHLRESTQCLDHDWPLVNGHAGRGINADVKNMAVYDLNKPDVPVSSFSAVYIFCSLRSREFATHQKQEVTSFPAGKRVTASLPQLLFWTWLLSGERCECFLWNVNNYIFDEMCLPLTEWGRLFWTKYYLLRVWPRKCVPENPKRFLFTGDCVSICHIKKLNKWTLISSDYFLSVSVTKRALTLNHKVGMGKNF